jgi:hypothetical protein
MIFFLSLSLLFFPLGGLLRACLLPLRLLSSRRLSCLPASGSYFCLLFLSSISLFLSLFSLSLLPPRPRPFLCDEFCIATVSSLFGLVVACLLP